MRMYDLIKKKRDGQPLEISEINWMIEGYTNGDIPDYQMSAFAMAVYYHGMTDEELAALTMAMVHSGDQVDLSRFAHLSVDKHSTGGVGDKTSLIVTPLVASLGGIVAKMSGRGLGHTGGTVDKLESFCGYQTTLSPEAFISQVEKIGIALIGQSGNLTPADKKLYALRDVTATIDSLPLIASSIMSKKIAAGAKSIVLDVKVGSGSFNKTYDDAKSLAEKMVSLGNRCGRNVSAVMTDMDTPLGFAVGNIPEVKEALHVLKGEDIPDLKEVCLVLAGEMLSLCHGWSREESRHQAEKALSAGKAYDKFKEWIQAQGGDPSWADHTERFPKPLFTHTVMAPQEGYIVHMNSEKIGRCAVLLGAGREKKDDAIDLTAGMVLQAKTGDYVKPGDPLATFYTNDSTRIPGAEELYLAALTVQNEKPQRPPLVYGIITKQE